MAGNGFYFICFYTIRVIFWSRTLSKHLPYSIHGWSLLGTDKKHMNGTTTITKNEWLTVISISRGWKTMAECFIYQLMIKVNCWCVSNYFCCCFMCSLFGKKSMTVKEMRRLRNKWWRSIRSFSIKIWIPCGVCSTRWKGMQHFCITNAIIHSNVLSSYTFYTRCGWLSSYSSLFTLHASDFNTNSIFLAFIICSFCTNMQATVQSDKYDFRLKYLLVSLTPAIQMCHTTKKMCAFARMRGERNWNYYPWKLK